MEIAKYNLIYYLIKFLVRDQQDENVRNFLMVRLECRVIDGCLMVYSFSIDFLSYDGVDFKKIT